MGTYKGIYNLDATNFNKELDVEEEKEEETEAGKAKAAAAFAEDYDSEEDDDSLIGGDLYSDSEDEDEEEGEHEIEEELSDEELAALDKMEKADRADVENAAASSKSDSMSATTRGSKHDKKGGKSVLGKRKRPISLEYE